jgi:large subunit ribosomal protein L6
MSRVGKKAIQIPDKTTVSYTDRIVTVKGPKGVLSRTVHPAIDLKIDASSIHVIPVNETREVKALQGLFRSLVANMVTGVSAGFSRILEINGIGYRADVAGNALKLSLGYSHPIDFKLPEGISAVVDKQNNITLSGIDNELLGETAATIRRLRPPEPYKGKGLKYSDEYIYRKAGKTGTK